MGDLHQWMFEAASTSPRAYTYLYAHGTYILKYTVHAIVGLYVLPLLAELMIAAWTEGVSANSNRIEA
jgi:hypothetical protein